MEHQCIIGLVYKNDDSVLVTLDGLRNHIEDNLYFNEIAIHAGMPMRKKVYTISDYADRRKSTNLRRFEYCPECGKKIDWKKLRKGSEVRWKI